MIRKLNSKAKLFQLPRRGLESAGGPAVLALALGVAVGSLGIAEAAVRAGALRHPRPAATARVVSVAAQPAPLDAGPAWEGRDIDGDGAPDFANPTGAAPRGHDAYGDGYFHAPRDGGARTHEGVDYDSTPGQPVTAPISGYVARIGLAYADDQNLKYVEIANPALHLEARVFYVNPSVEEGQSVALGRPIGTAHSLQRRYGGITDHIHLELAERGRKIDAETVILARAPVGGLMAAMN